AVVAEKADSAIPETQLWSRIMQDTQNKELLLVVNDIKIIRQALGEMEEKEQPFTTYVSKPQRKKKNKQVSSVEIHYHTRSKGVPPHHLSCMG
ncbi:hypothetical protein A2U01_0043049, partial [Trifolium medium]|nr:hypothetical protein [Trifolium medium]